MITKAFKRTGGHTVALVSGLGFLSASAWVSFGLGAGLLAIGLSLIAGQEVIK